MANCTLVQLQIMPVLLIAVGKLLLYGYLSITSVCLQCSGAVSWVPGRASIVYDNILRLSQDSLRSTLTGHFQYRENDKKCATRRVIINLMDNNKRKPKLVAEHPVACRRCRDGAAVTWDDVVVASRWGVDCGCQRAMAVGEPTNVRHEGRGTLGM